MVLNGRKNGRSSGKRNIAGALILAVAFAAVTGLSFAYLTRSVNGNIVEANVRAMEELALHDRTSIANSVRIRLDCMETVARKLSVRGFADTDEMFAEMIRMVQAVPSAEKLFFLDGEGTEYNSSGVVTKNSYLADVCKGRTGSFVLRINTSARLPELVREMLFEGVPVSFTVGGRRMEWMVCQFPLGALEDELKISSYGGSGYSSVIDAEGNYIIHVSGTSSHLSRENLFEDLSGAVFGDYAGPGEVLAAAAAGTASAVYTKDGAKHIMVVAPFEFSGWYLITTVPASVFDAQTREIVLRFVILLAVIAVILAGVLLMLFRQRKERERRREEQRLQKERERRKLIDGITSAYNVAYVVNLSDDTFENLRMDDDIIGHGESFGNFTQTREHFIRLLYPGDRERMRALLDYGAIRNRLAGAPSFSEEYRVPIGGAMIWHTLNVAKIDADTVTVGFSVDDLGITKKHLEDKRFSEYFALYEADLDTETVKVIIDSPFYPVERTGKALPYRATMKAFSGTLDGDAREFFAGMADTATVKKIFADEDKFTYTYRSNNLDARWVDLTSFVTLRHDDGTPAMFTLGFSYIDSFGAARQELQSRVAEQKTELEQSLTFTNFFLEPYDTAYYLSLKDLSWKTYKRPEYIARDYPDDENYLGPLSRYIQNEVHPDYREAMSVLTDPERLRAELTARPRFTVDYLRNDGDATRWYRCFVIRGATADYAAVAFIDITAEIEEQRRRENELKDALRMAQSASKAKSDFLFSMSHDIRTPMNAITGFTAMAKKYIGDQDAVKDYLEKIDDSGKQLLSLVNNVLEMARIESGKQELDEKPVDIRRALHSTVTVLSEQAHVNGQEFNYTEEGVRHFSVFSDEAMVSSVTMNIVSNALKYTPEGGRIDFIFKEIAARKPGYATYLLTVADTGIGMSREFLSTVFDPFARERTSTVSGVQGTGLGLAIVKRFVDLMGGDISVQSEPGKGTRFDVTLDFRINGAAPEKTEKKAEGPRVSFRGMRALLVEDNEMNREIALDILSDEGLLTEAAENGAVAVDLMKEKGPDYYDFILMDIQMPVMNGYEATKAIRTMYPDRRIPIIALSANAFAEDKAASMAAGMDDHVAKPINVRELFAALEKVM